MKANYRTDVRLGERYRDAQTGITGTATAVTFHQHGCERVGIETVIDGKIEEYAFDAPRLVHVETERPVTAVRVGGPAKGVSHVRPGPVSR